MTALRERIEAEFEQIERVLAELPERRPYSDLSILELAGVSTLLHNFYNGIENILKHGVQYRELGVPDGASWHRDLVNLAASENLISTSTAETLKPFLAFRHFFVHACAIDLHSKRLEPLSQKARDVFASFKIDIERIFLPNQ